MEEKEEGEEGESSQRCLDNERNLRVCCIGTRLKESSLDWQE